MSLPTATSPAPAGVPQRAMVAKYSLFGAAPLAVLTLGGSGEQAGDLTTRVVLFVLAAVSPVVLVLVGRRVERDHAPAGAAAGRVGRWDWSDVLAFLPATAGAALITGSLLVGITQAVDQGLATTARTAMESFASQAATYGAALAALGVLLLLRRGLWLADLGWRLPRRFPRAGWWPWIPVAVAGAYVALELATWLGSISTQLLPNAPNTQCTSVRGEYGGYVAVAIPLVCVIAPIAEETIFRGFLHGWLRRHLPVLPAVLVSAAIFSAAHAVLVLALPLFGVGVLLAVLYECSGSLLPGAIVHGLFNLVGIVAILGSTSSC